MKRHFHRTKSWLQAALLVGLAVAAQASGPYPEQTHPGFLHHEGVVEFLRPNGSVAVRILVEIADDPDSWAKGLMGRTQMAENEGMLFIYPEAQPQVFWMRNTPISLDMIFIGDDGRVVRVARRTRPMSDRHYHSIDPARYVVEVPAGFAERNHIRKGTEFRWQRY
jgi:hypothetical protein